MLEGYQSFIHPWFDKSNEFAVRNSPVGCLFLLTLWALTNNNRLPSSSKNADLACWFAKVAAKSLGERNIKPSSILGVADAE